jgi:hypothetical protein
MSTLERGSTTQLRVKKWTLDQLKDAKRLFNALMSTVDSSRGVRQERCSRSFISRLGHGSTGISQHITLVPLLISIWYSLIQKHLKRQIISLQGGFQVIADLNAYHAFILSLKIGGSQNGQQLAQDFAAFKMLGHVFIVEDAKDLATIVRDTARYGGRFRPEVSTTFLGLYVLPHPERRMCTSSSNAGAIGRKLKRQ